MRNELDEAAHTAAQRRAATEQHQRAISAINEMFDRADELVAARNRLTGVEPLGAGDDLVRDAETLLAHAGQLEAALCQLRAAALTAAEHRNRNDLAADIGTKVAVLFPRPARRDDEQSLTLQPLPPALGATDETSRP